MWVEQSSVLFGLVLVFPTVSSIPLPLPPDCANNDTSKFVKSPINIDTSDTIDKCSPPLIFSIQHWLPGQRFYVHNNGYYAEYIPVRTGVVNIAGGPLCGMFTLSSFHFHWSKGDYNGSEHTINNKRSSMELHMVYINQKYTSLENALNNRDGVTVLGFLIEAKEIKNNRRFDVFLESLDRIIMEPEETLSKNISFKFVKPAIKSIYYHYQGSLTRTSAEPVQWIIFTRPLIISPEQIEPFRKLLNCEGEELFNTFPIQTSEGAVVFRETCGRYMFSRKTYNRPFIFQHVPSWTLQGI